MNIAGKVILAISLIYIIANVFWSTEPELFAGADQLDSMIFTISSGYVVSFIFYYVYVSIPNQQKKKRKQKLAQELLCHIVFYGQEISRVLDLPNGFDGCSGQNISEKLPVIISSKEFDMNIFFLSRSGECRKIAIDDYIVRFCKAVLNIGDKYIYAVGDEFPELVTYIIQSSESASEVLFEYESQRVNFDEKKLDWHYKIPIVFYRSHDLITRAKKPLNWSIDTAK